MEQEQRVGIETERLVEQQQVDERQKDDVQYVSGFIDSCIIVTSDTCVCFNRVNMILMLRISVLRRTMLTNTKKKKKTPGLL